MASPFGPVQCAFQATTSASAATSSPGITTTSGNLLIAIVTCFGNHIGVSPMTDNFSNTWLSAVASVGTSSGFAAVFYVQNCIGGVSHTATFTPSASDFQTITFIEVSGAALTGALSSSATSVQATANHTAGPITANASTPELFIGAGSVSSGASPKIATTNPGTWWQLEAVTGSVTEGCINAFRLIKSGASDSYVFTAGAQNEAAIIVGFKAAAAATGASTSAFTFFGA